MNFADYAKQVLDYREKEGIRAIDDERLRFEKHLATTAFARKQVSAISSADVAGLFRDLSRTTADDHRASRLLNPGTIKKVRSLASAVLDRAIEDGLRPDNPVLAVKVRGKAPEAPWAILNAAEQRALKETPGISEQDKALVLFALGTGLRQGEQWALRREDIFLADRKVLVRESKSGKSREVPLFGYGLWAAERASGSSFAFPTVTGLRRARGAPQDFPRWLRAAGILRPVRWHDLRHTCASSLVRGTWGKRWPLVDARDMLGHSSVTVTEKYLHGTNMHEMAAQMEDI